MMSDLMSFLAILAEDSIKFILDLELIRGDLSVLYVWKIKINISRRLNAEIEQLHVSFRREEHHYQCI